MFKILCKHHNIGAYLLRLAVDISPSKLHINLFIEAAHSRQPSKSQY
jgi:hypothetical protein